MLNEHCIFFVYTPYSEDAENIWVGSGLVSTYLGMWISLCFINSMKIFFKAGVCKMCICYISNFMNKTYVHKLYFWLMLSVNNVIQNWLCIC